MSNRDTGQLALFDSPIKKIEKASTWVIHVDGASRGNPGPSGAGIYIYDKTAAKALAKEGFYLGTKTNNQAEYLALALAVILLQQLLAQHQAPIETVQIISDSELLIKQMQGHYRVKNAALLEIKLVAERLLRSVPHSFKHVLREHNKIADQLANQGVDLKKKVPMLVREELKSINLSLP